jgi:hypothetical protein
MNVDIETSDGKIPRKRGRDADIMIHADGISSFEARRINVGLQHLSVVALQIYDARSYLDSSS